MSWGVELFDQFENVSLHTLRGIDFCDRFASFLKELCVIENDYAAKIKKLVKGYLPKKKEESEFTYAKYFVILINELNDIAGQHEFIAENLTAQIVSDLLQLIQSLRLDRKKYIQDGTKQMNSLQSQLSELEKAKKLYEKSHREAERTLELYKKADADIHLSRADVEKAKNTSIARQRTCDESKNAYAAELQKTNHAQHEHYHALMPRVFDNLQSMEEQRINKVKDYMQKIADVEGQAIPIINTCISGIVTAAKSISSAEDSRLTVEKFKSGFLMPTDIPFEEQESTGLNGNHSGLSSSVGSTSSPTVSTVRARSRSTTRMDSIRGTVSGGSGRSKKRAALLNFFSKDEETKEDYSHLPPNQQKKKLQEKIDTLRASLAKQTAARDGLLKMQDVFSKNPKMGDPASLSAQLDENSQVLDKLQQEIRKYEGFINEADNRSLQPDSLSGSNSSLSLSTSSQQTIVQQSPLPTPNHDRNSSSSSTIERSESSASNSSVKRHAPVAATSLSTSPLHTSSEQHDSFDNEDYDDEVIDAAVVQPIGTCIALYPFDAPSEGSIPMKTGDDFFILESDQGDGWTRVRRRTNGEEGFVPTSYIRCHPNTSV